MPGSLSLRKSQGWPLIRVALEWSRLFYGLNAPLRWLPPNRTAQKSLDRALSRLNGTRARADVMLSRSIRSGNACLIFAGEMPSRAYC